MRKNTARTKNKIHTNVPVKYYTTIINKSGWPAAGTPVISGVGLNEFLQRLGAHGVFADLLSTCLLSSDFIFSPVLTYFWEIGQ